MKKSIYGGPNTTDTNLGSELKQVVKSVTIFLSLSSGYWLRKKNLRIGKNNFLYLKTLQCLFQEFSNSLKMLMNISN